MTILWALLLCVVVLVGWLLNLLALPGNWLIAVAVVVYALFTPPDTRAAIGWPVVALVIGLAVLGELVELAAGAAGARRAGGSRRAAVLALAGGVGGAMVGAVVGVPIPVIGPIIAAVLFAGIGALAGATLGEVWAGRSLQEGLKVGEAAFWGRLLGTLGKVIVASIMVAATLIALVV